MTRATWVSRATAVALVFSGIVAGCGPRASLPSGTPVERAGVWRVSAANAPPRARVGDNTLTIAVRDSAGRPMRGTVEAIVSMPAMGAMPYMENRGKVRAAGPGAWQARYGLPMNGEWDVTVRLHPDAGPDAEARYRLSTMVDGLAFGGGTPAAGASVATAAVGDSSGVIALDAARRQQLGIRTDLVQLRPLGATIRVPGRVAYDESGQSEVALKFGGFVRELVAQVTGQPVARGQVLLTAWSPELWAAQQEALEAARAAAGDRASSALGGASSDLARAARERLLLWDLAPGDVDAMLRSGRPLAAFPVRAPAGGVVTEKNVVAGSAFQAGQVLFRIARVNPVWVIASVPQSDLSRVRLGMGATLRDPYAGTAGTRGRVAFVSPAVDSMTRTGEVRITVANPGGALRPGTFLDVTLASPPVPRLTVPESAVLPTGERQVVFVDLGDGRLAPRDVTIGVKADGWDEVLSGLKAGDRVVTSGNFLIGAESQLRSATGKW
ncbi:MAG TPA: efflux RND transporter periplasmic adaptor subunit [Candidatus Eisenbacteria bacterium]|nr:efflux RND transporter periplasmic adaptor subunit [Candidatus Eisenbacteria bacterium]